MQGGISRSPCSLARRRSYEPPRFFNQNSELLMRGSFGCTECAIRDPEDRLNGDLAAFETTRGVHVGFQLLVVGLSLQYERRRQGSCAQELAGK